jgi:hypothetical protein
MARYRPVDMSPRLLPVVLAAQLLPGTFADAVHRLVDVLDLSAFDDHYRNDAAGAPAQAWIDHQARRSVSAHAVDSRRAVGVERGHGQTQTGSGAGPVPRLGAVGRGAMRQEQSRRGAGEQAGTTAVGDDPRRHVVRWRSPQRGACALTTISNRNTHHRNTIASC